jgi:hypothetical protein
MRRFAWSVVSPHGCAFTTSTSDGLWLLRSGHRRRRYRLDLRRTTVEIFNRILKGDNPIPLGAPTLSLVGVRGWMPGSGVTMQLTHFTQRI